MKRIMIFSVLAAGSMLLSGADKVPAPQKNLPTKSPVEIKSERLVPGMVAEPLSITAGEKRVVNLPFAVESCKTNSSNVKIESIVGSTFEIVGVSPGKAIVTVIAGGIEKEFNITVFNSTLQTYQELGRLLEEVPEVTLELRDDGLTLRGVIVLPAHWRYYQQIMTPYKDRCRNYVTFQPDSRLIENLKKQLTEAGFPIVDKAGPLQPGKLSFRISGQVLTIFGSLLSDQSIKKVKQILSAQEWLNPDWNGNNFRVETDLSVAPCQIDLGIVFVGVTRTQLERLGNSLADGTVLTWDVIGWFKALYEGVPNSWSGKGQTQFGGSVNLQSNLKGTLVFFGNNGISDFRDAGHITLTNNSKEAASFENGGTRSVMVYGRDNADLKEIDFGLKYKAKGVLLEDNLVKLELELERNLPPVRDDKDYVQRKSKTKTELTCPLGKTAVIAGQKELTFTKNGPAGYAFLRHVPVLDWFFSFEEDSGEEIQILILVAPELMHQQVTISTRPSQETAPLEADVSKKVNTADKTVTEKENHGWFRRMFDW